MNALPPRIPKPAKRASRWRSVAHCNFVRGFRCCVPDCDDRPIEVAHVRVGSGAGIGQKPDDWNVISLCQFHHGEQHRVGEGTFAVRHGIDLKALAAAFAKASPKRRDIEQEMRERGNGRA